MSTATAAPSGQFRWFRETKNPVYTRLASGELKSASPQVQKMSPGSPTNTSPNITEDATWKVFSDDENQVLEEAFLNRTTNKVIVGDDFLHEVDLRKMHIYPAYWEGPVYAVIRTQWFSVDGSSIAPTSSQLSAQLEEGYQELKPWTAFTDATLDDKAKNAVQKAKDKFKHNLRDLGKAAHYVVYTSRYAGWVMSESLPSTVAHAVLVRLSSGADWGGIRVVRGYEHALKRSSPEKPSTSPTRSKPSSGRKRSVSVEEPKKVKPTLRERMSKVKHLVLLTHGIGQKMAEKTPSMSFINDVNGMRKVFKDSFQQILAPEIEKTADSDASPTDYGVMLLPVEWRKHMEFDKPETPALSEGELPKKTYPSINDIAIDAIPALRSLASDVILDVLLYMEPRHRADMLTQMIKEMNRVYALFIERHPDFIKQGGKVHVFAHSLGTVITFDILCYYNYTRHQWLKSHPSTPKPQLDPSDNASESTKKRVTGKARLPKLAPPSHVTETLTFPVDKYFVVGSPIAMFALLKGKQVGAPLASVMKYYQDWRDEFRALIESRSDHGHGNLESAIEKRMQTLQGEIDELVESVWDSDFASTMHPDCRGMYSIVRLLLVYDNISFRSFTRVILSHTELNPW